MFTSQKAFRRIEMNFPTVNKFLWCLELETAGVILGWLTVSGFGFLFCFLGGFAVFLWIIGDVIVPPPESQTFIHELLLGLLNFSKSFSFIFLFDF